MRFQYVLSEIGAGLRRNLTMTLAVVLTVAISMTFLGASLLMRAQADEMKTFWYDKVEISVFMCNEYDADLVASCSNGAVTAEQREQIRQTIETHPEVRQVFEESQEEAYENLKEFDESIAASTSPDHLQESFRVALEDPERFDGVTSAVSGLPGVADVVDQREILEQVFELFGTVEAGSLTVAIVLVIAAVLLITNTIRLAAYNRRRETAIMRLVGASNFYIQLPFILEAAVAGLVGAVLACIGVLVVKWQIIDGALASVGVFSPQTLIGWGDTAAVLPVLLIVGVALSAMSAMITLRRYLRV